MDTLLTARANLLENIAEQAASDLPDAGWRWASYAMRLREEVEGFNTPLDVIHAAQNPDAGAGFEARMTGDQLEAHARLMEDTCRDLFPQFAAELASFAEYSRSRKETVTELNGRLVSSPLYNLIIHTMRCLTYARPQRVMEIGGGFGGPGRVWMTNGIHNPDLYIDVDLPESLFFAEVYLKEALPDHAVTMFDGRAVPEQGILLCPVSRLGALLRLTRVDLIVNTGSLQEMPDDYVSFYRDSIDRADCDLFYSSNYFAQPIDELMESMNFAAPILPRNWAVEFFAYYDNPSRGVAEVLFRRSNPSRIRAALQVARMLLAGAPKDGAEFFRLFDATRRVGSRLVMPFVSQAAIRRMPFVPKEALYLARQTGILTTKLEARAMEGRAKMGVVGAPAAGYRDEMMQN